MSVVPLGVDWCPRTTTILPLGLTVLLLRAAVSVAAKVSARMEIHLNYVSLRFGGGLGINLSLESAIFTIQSDDNVKSMINRPVLVGC